MELITFLHALLLRTKRIHTDRPFKISSPGDQRVKGVMWTSREIDFRFSLNLKITLVESTYPSQRPQCPSLSPHFLLGTVILSFLKKNFAVN